jgi:exodeoxyribonuclease V alpha subunit
MTAPFLWKKVAGFSPLDRELARVIGEGDPVLEATVARLSEALRTGHSCLPLAALAAQTLFDEASAPVFQFPGHAELADKLRGSAAVSLVDAINPEPREFRPVVFDGTRLYLRRYFDQELGIARSIARLARAGALAVSPELEERLSSYFLPSSGRSDRQKDAVARSLRLRVSLITGGPGTGKTTTVVKVLALAIERALESGRELQIGLLAPTGKASERLLQATRGAAERLDLSNEVRARLPQESKTIHRALGVIPGVKTRFRHTQQDPLPFDLLVVDEASMIDLPLMNRLMDAIRPDAQLLLLGDADQLASVDAGSVLSELALAADSLGDQDSFSFGISRLTESYRFSGASEIMELATGFRLGQREPIEGALKGSGGQVVRFEASELRVPRQSPEFRRWLEARVRESLEVGDVEEALAKLNQFQVLCALRSGPWGAQGVNDWVRSLAQGILRTRVEGVNYPGRRIMVVENEPRVGLYNGDVGVLWSSARGVLEAHFPGEAGRKRTFSLAELPAHEDAFAVTIHKSQGSEYDEVALVVPPDAASALLTRELLYTGVTRARSRVKLLASLPVLFEAASRRVERYSGLADKIVQSSRSSSSTP